MINSSFFLSIHIQLSGFRERGFASAICFFFFFFLLLFSCMTVILAHPPPHFSLRRAYLTPIGTPKPLAYLQGSHACKPPLPSLPSASSSPPTACFALPVVSIGTRLGVWAAQSMTDRQWDAPSTPATVAAFPSTLSPCSWKRRNDARHEPGPPDDRGSLALRSRD